MRSGKGIQRWPDGKTYSGNWDNHVYHGEGSLYADYEDITNEVKPIYKGEWLSQGSSVILSSFLQTAEIDFSIYNIDIYKDYDSTLYCDLKCFG